MAPSFWLLPPVGVFAFFWLLGNLTATTVVQQFCFIAMLVALVWGAVGASVARVLAFPAAFLLFALPIGDFIVPLLQDWTAGFAVKLLQLTRVPVLLEEHVIAIPGSQWRVADACSGINYLIASVALGYAYAGITYRYWSHRIGFVLAASVIPLVGNGLRVYTTIVIASLGATGIAAGLEHNIYGWIVFSMMIYLLFRFCGNWHEDSAPVIQRFGARERLSAPHLLFRVTSFAAAAVVLAGSAPLSADWFTRPYVAQASWIEPNVRLPWRPLVGHSDAWRPQYVKPAVEYRQDFESGNRVVKLFAAYYDVDQSDVKLASTTNILFDQATWWVVAGESRPVTLDGQTFR